MIYQPSHLTRKLDHRILDHRIKDANPLKVHACAGDQPCHSMLRCALTKSRLVADDPRLTFFPLLYYIFCHSPRRQSSQLSSKSKSRVEPNIMKSKPLKIGDRIGNRKCGGQDYERSDRGQSKREHDVFDIVLKQNQNIEIAFTNSASSIPKIL